MKNFPVLLLVNYVVILAIGYGLADLEGPVDAAQYLSLRSVLAQIIVMPFIETVFFQFLLIEGCIWLSTRLGQKVIVGYVLGGVVSAVAFFWAHYQMNGPFNGYAFGVPGGITFAIAYLSNRDHRKQIAFFSAWMLHTASNALFMASCAFFLKIM